MFQLITTNTRLLSIDTNTTPSPSWFHGHPQKERSKETVSHLHSKEDVGRSGEDELHHAEPPVSEQPQSYPADMLEIAGMDYSPAKRVPPIHNWDAATHKIKQTPRHNVVLEIGQHLPEMLHFSSGRGPIFVDSTVILSTHILPATSSLSTRLPWHLSRTQPSWLKYAGVSSI